MARSFYKERGLGTRPACAICVGAGEGPREALHLPCGVSVWLCAAHRSMAFQTRRAGRDLEASLFHVWNSAGCLTRSRVRALTLHRARLTAGMPDRPAPGSYSWPSLRREAEAAFSAGEEPGAFLKPKMSITATVYERAFALDAKGDLLWGDEDARKGDWGKGWGKKK